MPKELLSKIRKRSNRNEASRFPYKLWSLLEWAGTDPARGEVCGCGWVNETVFFLNKPQLCQVMEIKVNTMNVNLNNLGFYQADARKGEKTFWTNDKFSAKSSPDSLQSIRTVESHVSYPEGQYFFRAVYLPLLDSMTLYKLSNSEISSFKVNVVNMWESLFHSKFVFAVSLKDFIRAFEEKACLYHDYYVFQEALDLKTPNTVEILEFAIFLARFGPFDSLIYKLNQLQQIIPEVRQETNPQRSIQSFFAPTFHNCFRFSLSIGEYHCYNIPHISSNSNFLIDEEERRYSSWQIALQNQNLLSSANPIFF